MIWTIQPILKKKYNLYGLKSNIISFITKNKVSLSDKTTNSIIFWSKQKEMPYDFFKPRNFRFVLRLDARERNFRWKKKKYFKRVVETDKLPEVKKFNRILTPSSDVNTLTDWVGAKFKHFGKIKVSAILPTPDTEINRNCGFEKKNNKKRVSISYKKTKFNRKPRRARKELTYIRMKSEKDLENIGISPAKKLYHKNEFLISKRYELRKYNKLTLLDFKKWPTFDKIKFDTKHATLSNKINIIVPKIKHHLKRPIPILKKIKTKKGPNILKKNTRLRFSDKLYNSSRDQFKKIIYWMKRSGIDDRI